MGKHTHKRLWLAAVVAGVVASLLCDNAPAFAHDSNGFYYGTDSNNPYNVSGVNPYKNYFAEKGGSGNSYNYRGLGGYYGGYFGRVGGFWSTRGCTNGPGNQWNMTDVKRSYSNDVNHKRGIGPVMTWWLGGPGRDPRYSRTYYNNHPGRAHQWGKLQAEDAVRVWGNRWRVLSTVIFADMEGGGEGWNHYNYSNCTLGSSFSGDGIAVKWDRRVINGWRDYLSSVGLHAGVYASHYYWNDKTFECYNKCTSGHYGYVPHLFKWTYGNTDGHNSVDCTPSTTCEPHGNWTVCDSYGCVSARWFGGGRPDGSGPKEVAWQWATPSRTTGGDFDQIAVFRLRSLQVLAARSTAADRP